MFVIGFFKDWYNFLRENAIRHMKRISIAVGSYIILLIVFFPLGKDIFLISATAGFVEASVMIVMSIFGKNGNGNIINNNTVQ